MAAEEHKLGEEDDVSLFMKVVNITCWWSVMLQSGYAEEIYNRFLICIQMALIELYCGYGKYMRDFIEYTSRAIPREIPVENRK